MRNKVKTVVSVVLIMLVPCVLVLLMQKHNRLNEYKSNKAFDNLVTTVYFEGNVVSSPVFKNSTLLCIKLDTASVDSFYYFSREWTLCIREGVAVMPIGMIDRYDSTDRFEAAANRVVVNKDYSGKTLFINGTDTLTQDLHLWPGKLEEIHLLTALENTQKSVKLFQ